MKIVGKSMVVLVFVMSLVFMTMALAVHATHVNWRDAVLRPADQVGPGAPLGLRGQLEAAQAREQELQTEKNRLQTDIEQAKREWAMRLAQLETRAAELKTELEKEQNQLATANSSLRDAVAQMEAAQTKTREIQTEVDSLRNQVDTIRLQRDDNLKKVVELGDQLADMTGKKDRLEARNAQLAAELSKYRIALTNAGVQLDRSGPPPVNGVVLRTDPDGYVTISLGFEDGLDKNSELDVYRLGATEAATKYLGRIRVVEVESDRAIAQVIRREGVIQTYDRVATKL